MRAFHRRVARAAIIPAALAAGYLATATPALLAGPPATATFAASLHQARAAAGLTYRVHAGDTLTSIYARSCHARAWPRLWWRNRQQVPDPNLLLTHITLSVPACRDPRPSTVRGAMAAIPPPPPPPPAPAPQQAGPVAQSAPAAAGPAAAPAPATGTYSGGSGFQQCVIAAESGGNPSAVNPSSGAGGLYQFLPSTWAALGHSGSPQNASVAEQNQAFAQEYAQSGTAAWAPYDGC